MKIYTKTGDKGKTSLFSGERVTKNHARVETYGEIDELNSYIGMIAAFLPPKQHDLVAEIQDIQKTLFVIGAQLATKPHSERARQLFPLASTKIISLEQSIDRMESKLPPLHSFILPGGGPASASAHVARTVCRRAERRLVNLVQCEKPSDAKPDEQMALIQQFLNRLSDYLFVVARYCNLIADIADMEYLPGNETSTPHDF